MDIEPLKSILEWSPDKKETLLYYLPYHVTKKVIRFDFEDKSLYVQDRIFCIRRNTLELEYDGSIVFIDKGKIGLKVTSVKRVDGNKKCKTGKRKLQAKDNKSICFWSGK